MIKPAHDITQRLAHDISAKANSVVRPLDTAVRVLRMKQVVQRTNLSRSTLYALTSSDPTFPRKVRLSARSIGFLEHEIEAWILARIEKSDGQERKSQGR